MPQAWIDIIAADGTRQRHTLKGGLTTVGGKRGDIALAGSDNDQLHVWDQPPKLIYVGSGPPPSVNGQACDERALRPGDRIQWRGATLEFGGVPHAQIEEIPIEAPRPAASAGAPLAPMGAGLGEPDAAAWRRIKAGLLVELGIADSGVARRWQEAILRNEYEPDSCARDLLAASPPPPPSDPRLMDRCARLERDLVMAPMQTGVRSSGRKLRASASNWLAMAIAQFVVFGICCLLVFVVLFVLRLRWSWSVDGFLDRVSQSLSGS